MKRQNITFLLVKQAAVSPLEGCKKLQAVGESPCPEAGPGSDLQELITISLPFSDTFLKRKMTESQKDCETPNLILEEYQFFLNVELRVKAVDGLPFRKSNLIF